MKENTQKSENKQENSNKYLFFVIILVGLLIVLAISGTYAYYKIAITGDGITHTQITGSTDCIDISFTEVSSTSVGTIGLPLNYPVTDKWALGKTDGVDNLKPMEIKITNNCKRVQNPVNYILAITTLSTDEVSTSILEGAEDTTTHIPDNKIRFNYQVDNGTLGESGQYLSSLAKIKNPSNIKILEDEIDKKLDTRADTYKTKNYYIIENSSIETGESKTFKVRLWVDYYEGDAQMYSDNDQKTHDPNYDNTTENKTFESIISLIANPSAEA